MEDKDPFEITPKQARELWIQALRSGYYCQGRGYLHNVEKDTYCCLGVACEVFRENMGNLPYKEGPAGIDDTVIVAYYDDREDILPTRVAAWLGLSSLNGETYLGYPLTTANDNGASFKTIAEVIQSGKVKLTNY
jgi:hypothetical protein